MIDFYDIDLIEQYLLGNLDKNTQELILAKVEKDPTYATELKWYALALKAIRETGKIGLKKELTQQQQALKTKGFFEEVYNDNNLDRIVEKSIEQQAKKKLENDITQIHTKLKDKGFFDQIYKDLDPPQTPSIAKKRNLGWLAMAASVSLLLAIGSYWLFFSTPTLFEREFALYPDRISQEIDIQLNAMGFKPIDKDAIIRLQKGIAFYNQEELEKAVPIFEQYLIVGKKQWRKAEIQLYLAVAYLGLEETEKAENILILLHQDKNEGEIQVTATWYLALIYIKTNKQKKAITLLESIEKDSTYASKAREVLEQLK